MADLNLGDLVTIIPFCERRTRRATSPTSLLVDVDHHGWGAAAIVTARSAAERYREADVVASRLLGDMRGTCRTIGPQWSTDEIDPAYDGSLCPSDLGAEGVA